MKLGPEQSVQMPMKTVISLIIMVALGTFGFFQIQEKLNQHATKIEIMEKDLTMNSEFWIKWIIAILIGISIGIVIGFSIYHYFFMDKLSCCGVYG